jgi:ParB family chromosome partitioning protein
MHRKALGRGLEALIPTSSAALATESPEARSGVPAAGVQHIPIEMVGANPFQPRTRFNEAALQELTDSIKANGILQPVILRRSADESYELVAGERRLRAAKLAGLDAVPAIIREVDDRRMMELALIENIQREDLSPIDEAKAFHSLIQTVGLTNSLRLLGLPPEVQDMVSRGTLSAGHGRALLGLETSGDQLATARYVSSKGFSVRRTEALINRKLRRQHSRPRSKPTGLEEWQNKLQSQFATRVTMRPGRKGGRVEFEYYSQEDLERLLEAWGVL